MEDLKQERLILAFISSVLAPHNEKRNVKVLIGAFVKIVAMGLFTSEAESGGH